MIDRLTVDLWRNPAAREASQRLGGAGGEVYVVGGAVRDAVFGVKPNDIDLMVDGLTGQKVMDTLGLKGKDLVGKSFGVYHFTQDGSTVQVSLPRSEHSTGPGHSDFEVTVGVSVRQDLLRRDFTVNAMAWNVRTREIVDPLGGRVHIARRELRTTSRESFKDDPLRILRALVLCARFSFNLSMPTECQMRDYAHRLVAIPCDRAYMELDKLFDAPWPSRAIALAQKTGVLIYVFPDLAATFGYDQNNRHHQLDLGRHMLAVLRRIELTSKDPDLRIAALLHDIGKPGSAWVDPTTGMSHYYEDHYTDADGVARVRGKEHALLGAGMALRRLRELRFPNERAIRVCSLISLHMWAPFSTLRGARRFLAQTGDLADDLLTLRDADQDGKCRSTSGELSIPVSAQRDLVAQVRERRDAFTVKDLVIGGHDLLGLGMTPGPQVGEVLRSLLTAVVDDPDLNTREHLIELSIATLHGMGVS